MIRISIVAATLALLGAGSAAAPAAGGPPVAECRFTRGNPIPEQSSWFDQFKCYQTSGRHVSVVGSGNFEAGTVSGGVCLISVARDRVQVGACGSFGGEGTLVIPYSALAYVGDDDRTEFVTIYVQALFHR